MNRNRCTQEHDGPQTARSADGRGHDVPADREHCGLQSGIHARGTRHAEAQIVEPDHLTSVPEQSDIWWDPHSKWWDVTTLDMDRNGIHDSIQEAVGPVNVGLSFTRAVTDSDRQILLSMGFEIRQELPVVDAVLLGAIDPTEAVGLSQIDGVAMVERYGSLVFYGDVQTPAVKASNSSDYPVGAWDLDCPGAGST